MAARKVKEVRKAQYYVYYMGWKECAGMHGTKYTDDVVKELVQIHSRHPYALLNKLTVQLSSKEIKITQEIDKGRGRITKTKLPGIPAKDVCFAAQGPSPDDDTVAAIFLGYNPQTECAVHVHVYRCDSTETARIMVDHFMQITEIPEHKLRLGRIEQDLAEKGHIEPQESWSWRISPREEKNHSSPRRDEDSSSSSNIPKPPPVYKSLAEELKSRLTMTDEAPILLPPIDYDTMSRAQGKIALRNHRKSLQYDSIAPGGVFIRKFAEKNETDTIPSAPGSVSSSGSDHRFSEVNSSYDSERPPMMRMSSVPDSPPEARRGGGGYHHEPQLRHTFQEGDFRKLRRTDANSLGSAGFR